MQDMDNTKKFNGLLSELGDCAEIEQKEIIEEMKRVIDEMNKEELYAFFKTDIFYKIHEMIEEKKISLENAILVLKHIGHCRVLKGVWNERFGGSLLQKRFEKMIIDEEKKKEEKNEKLWVDLCECYILLNKRISQEFLSTGVSCLLKVALNKEENEEAKKKVEIALVTLGSIDKWECVEQELYLHESREIIQYHQEHHNLSRFAYQSAWKFSILRLYRNREFEEVIVNELHFGREAARELDELAKCVDWKRKKEERGRETKEELAITRWLSFLYRSFCSCLLMNEEYSGIIQSIAMLFRASRDNYEEISKICKYPLMAAAGRITHIEDLLKGEAIDAVLEEFQRPTLNDEITSGFLECFDNITRRLKEKKDRTTDEEKRKALKKEIFEKMEEEGYEDIVISFHEVSGILYSKYRYQYELSVDFSNYLVNV
ncbi:uncharacterized protein MONOS_15033 [Monocercomonoides exilis]|uniref:uncharacterized protein n=1 Tax=Monocercomonoides exilis TaxID=2049356 RepID=UPI00355A1F0D|nr:hypothetical protein MONOS_15033 [Monocercomonoides exilis]